MRHKGEKHLRYNLKIYLKIKGDFDIINEIS